MRLKNFEQFVNESKNRARKSLNPLNELDLSTYAKMMDKTESYPWIKFLGDKQKVAEKYKNINTLAKELFTREFEKKYNSESIKDGDTSYTFDTIKFNANYTNYSLIFKSKSGDRLLIKYATDGYYVDSSDFKDELDERSKNKLKEMLKYNKK